nr:hypothetical protein HmN_000987700 [Hymenolepis microstoma]
MAIVARPFFHTPMDLSSRLFSIGLARGGSLTIAHFNYVVFVTHFFLFGHWVELQLVITRGELRYLNKIWESSIGSRSGPVVLSLPTRLNKLHVQRKNAMKSDLDQYISNLIVCIQELHENLHLDSCHITSLGDITESSISETIHYEPAILQ